MPTGPLDVKVLVAPDGGGPMRFDEVGDDFYQITPAEAKALMDLAAAKRKEDETFKTRETRELEAARKKRVYRKAMIRVRFPDGVVLQATFSSSATVGHVLEWVESALRQPQAFELSIARGAALKELATTLEAAELCPAALLNFRSPAQEQAAPPFLQAPLMAQAQRLGLEVIPQSIGGGGGASFLEAKDGIGSDRIGSEAKDRIGQGRKPRWMK